jgi:uncharacterized membrane protein (DUF485 family)
MARLPRILQPKWKLFLKHHERIVTRPDPLAAKGKFMRRVAASKRVGLVRTGFFIGLYFSFIAAALGFVLDWLNVAASSLLALLQAVFSSLTVVFIAGIFICSRYLSYLEIDLHYYSAEARLTHPGP